MRIRAYIVRASALVAFALVLPTCTMLWHAGDYEFDRLEAPCADCVPADCTDGELGGSETDVDCGGGACPPCPGGLTCNDAADCQSAVCIDMHCEYPTCIDGVHNGEESDLDCGGSCPGCPDGSSCGVAGDCASGACSGGSCAAPSCTDAVQNGTETDVDCGGVDCGSCADGDGCLGPGDCASNVCTFGVCVPQNCNDRIQNDAETDVDCGGSFCAPCADGESCMVASDCQSGVCEGDICQVPDCMDTVHNGNETDVDCGGTCSPCVVGKGCAVDADCTTTVCVNQSCSPLNGCDPLTASDYTAEAQVTISFQGGGHVYDPPCIRVLPGSTITFSGNFNSKSLQGGKVVQGVKYPDPTSPFYPETSSGSSKSFTLPQSGKFPYYCVQHGGGGMTGVVFVQ